MLKISPEASDRIVAFLAGGKQTSIRIHVKPSLNEAAQLGLMFDDRRDGDAVYEVGGITYVVDRELLQRVQPIRIEADAVGLKFSSRLSAEKDGCGCGCGGH